MQLTPGLSFLLSVVPRLFLIPLCITHLAALALNHFSIVHIPTWAYVPSYILSIPVFIWMREIWTYLQEEREIKSMGAVRVPVVQGKWPGSLDLMISRLKEGKDGYPLESVETLAHQYGSIFNLRIMGEDRIMTCDPEHIKIMLATGFQYWGKNAQVKDLQKSVLGSGVFNTDGEMWKFHRSMTRPFFTRDRISDFETFGLHTDEAIHIIRSQSRGHSPIDYQDIVFRFTLDAATEYLFGSCVHSLRQGDNAAFGPAFGRLQHRLAQRSRSAPLWPLLEIWEDKTKGDMKIVHDFINPVIQDALRRKKNLSAEVLKQDTDSDRQTLLDHLVALTDDPAVIIDETLNILLAGRDTTAATITFLTYMLALHADVLVRLRAEILAQVGEIRHPTIEDLRGMKYLRAVINETLRLFPPVPSNARSPTKATTLPSSIPGARPFYIPSGVKVPYVPIQVHRNKDLWGPDAEIFDPDRFLDGRLQKYYLARPYIFVPFNAGPRICLGQQFAYNEISFFIIRLLQMFDHVELASDAQPPESLPPSSWANGPWRKSVEKIRPKSELTMYVEGGLWLRLREADGSAPSS